MNKKNILIIVIVCCYFNYSNITGMQRPCHFTISKYTPNDQFNRFLQSPEQQVNRQATKNRDLASLCHALHIIATETIKNPIEAAQIYAILQSSHIELYHVHQPSFDAISEIFVFFEQCTLLTCIFCKTPAYPQPFSSTSTHQNIFVTTCCGQIIHKHCCEDTNICQHCKSTSIFGSQFVPINTIPLTPQAQRCLILLKNTFAIVRNKTFNLVPQCDYCSGSMGTNFDDACLLGCSHAFHTSCLNLFVGDNICPHCSKPITFCRIP